MLLIFKSFDKFFILKLFLCLFSTYFKNVITKQTNFQNVFHSMFETKVITLRIKKTQVLADVSNLVSIPPMQP